MVIKAENPFDFSLVFIFQRYSWGLHRFERFKEEAIQGLYNGKSLFPNVDVVAPLIKHLLESMMHAELSNHLEEDKASATLMAVMVRLKHISRTKYRHF